MAAGADGLQALRFGVRLAQRSGQPLSRLQFKTKPITVRGKHMVIELLLAKLLGDKIKGGREPRRSAFMKMLIGKRKKKVIKYERDYFLKNNFK